MQSSHRRIPQRRRRVLRIGFIGAGRLGSALTWHCHRLGYPISGVLDKDRRRARSAVAQLGPGPRPVLTPDVIESTDVLFITTPDDTIGQVYRSIRGRLARGSIVAHCSGGLGADAFVGAKKLGHEVLLMHPIQVLATREQAVRQLPGSVFAIDGSPPGVRFGRRLARELGGSVLALPSGSRPLYHAMCVFASNLVVAALAGAERAADRLRLDRPQASRALLALAQNTVAAVAESGTRKALTGPVRRGDVATIKAHLAALRGRAPGLLGAYRELSLLLVDVARADGLPDSTARAIRATLKS